MSYHSTTIHQYGPSGQRKTVEYITDVGGHRPRGIEGFGEFGDGMFKKGGFGFGGGGGLFDGFGGSKPKEEDPGSRYSSGWAGTRRESRQPTGPPKKLTGVTYDELKSQCLKEGQLFEDPDFDAVDSNIFYSRAPPKPFVWKRPQEILGSSGSPEFFVGGASRFDVQQGELGDCWLLAAVSCLSQFPDLVGRVIPADQDFKDGYAGIFRFNFWSFGRWMEVVIDDRLPTFNNRLVFMHSSEKNEFWSSLLEKAYAKLSGSYEALKGGSTSEAMEDFTGGVTEMFELGAKTPPNLWSIMQKAHERESLMGCSLDADPATTEARLTNGLIMGHAYSVTGVKLVEIKTARKQGKVQLVRIRNPWGNECEWKGAWSDQSPEWQFIAESDRKEIGLVFDNDGEFWMSYQDFVKNFQKLEVCNLGPESLSEDAAAQNKKRWEMTCHDGAWTKRVNAGGCRNYLETFWTNPQYHFEVVDTDEGDNEDAGTVILALMQKERRKKRKEGLDLLTIGYAVYKLKNSGSDPLDVNFFKFTASIAKSPQFVNMREICGRHRLPVGNYCIVPSTYEPHEEADFMLRLYAEKPVTSKELDETTGVKDVRDEVAKGDVEKWVSVTMNSSPVVNPTSEDLKKDKEMREAFKKISGDDLEIDAYELQDILNAAFMKEFKFDGFSAETCRSLVAMKDIDRSGKLGYTEFKTLWNELRTWKTAFKNQDKDGSGNFNSFELRQSFHDIGFTISNQTFNALVQRYSHKDGKIYFDDFIHCIARLNTMFEIFKEMSRGDKKAHFSLDEFIQTTMYS